MSETTAPAEQVEQIDEETPESDAEVISIKRGKLLKLRHHIESLRQQLNEETKEVMKWKNKTSETTKTLIGELNDSIKREGS
jgi:predicted RNase H-like nuclease (RuvC/YqgF family)